MDSRGSRASQCDVLRQSKPPRAPITSSLPSWQAARPTLELFLPVASTPQPSGPPATSRARTPARQPSPKSQAASEESLSGRVRKAQKAATPGVAASKAAESSIKPGPRKNLSSKSLQALAAAAQAAGGSDQTEGVATSGGSKEKPGRTGKKRSLEAEEGDESEADPETGSGGTSQGAKRARLVWTAELHARFMRAMNHLGVKNAVPKTILQLMNVEGMTRENVASHLQKYRQYLKRMAGYPPNVKVSHDELQKIQQTVVEHEAAQQALQQSFGFLPMTAAPGTALHPGLAQMPYGGLGLAAQMGQAVPYDMPALTASQMHSAQMAHQAHYEMAAQPAALYHSSQLAQQQLNGYAALAQPGLHGPIPAYPSLPWLPNQQCGLPIFCQGQMIQENTTAMNPSYHPQLQAMPGYAMAHQALLPPSVAETGHEAGVASTATQQARQSQNKASAQQPSLPATSQGGGELASAFSPPWPSNNLSTYQALTAAPGRGMSGSAATPQHATAPQHPSTHPGS